MIFRKYDTIENVYNTEFINKIFSERKSSGSWVVHEKIHGSNFSIWYDGSEVQFASRSGFIGENTSFFGFQRHIENMKQFIKNIWTMLNDSTEYCGIKFITVFGELFGGSYHHPDVPKQQASSVQKGVYYSPALEFMVFDIAVEGSFIPVHLATLYVKDAGLFRFVPYLFTGTFEQCLQYPNSFDSTIPAILGLPSISDNTCEGVVIRHNFNAELFNGDRILLKNKNDKYKEKAESPKSPKIAEPISDALLNFLTQVSAYATEARVANVVSKIGEVTMKNFMKIHKDLKEDIRKDCHKDGINENILETEDAAKFGKLFARVCAEAVYRFFVEKGKYR